MQIKEAPAKATRAFKNMHSSGAQAELLQNTRRDPLPSILVTEDGRRQRCLEYTSVEYVSFVESFKTAINGTQGKRKYLNERSMDSDANPREMLPSYTSTTRDDVTQINKKSGSKNQDSLPNEDEENDALSDFGVISGMYPSLNTLIL